MSEADEDVGKVDAVSKADEDVGEVDAVSKADDGLEDSGALMIGLLQISSNSFDHSLVLFRRGD